MDMMIDNAEISTGIGKICYLAAVADILSRGGMEITEEDLLIATTALSMKTEYVDGQFEFRCADIHDDFELYQKEIRSLGWDIEEIMNVSCEEFKSAFNKNMNCKKSMLLTTDVYYLPYHTYYHQVHECHIVAVLEKKNNRILLADYLILGLQQKAFLGWIDYCDEMFDISDAAKYCRNLFWSLENIESVNKISSEYLAIRLKETASELLRGDVIPQIYNLKNYYCEIFDINDKMKIKEQLILMDKMIALAGGVSPARNLIGSFFENKKEFYDLDLAKRYYELSRLWKVIAKLSIRGSLTQDKKILEKIQDRLDEINILERDCAERIMKM